VLAVTPPENVLIDNCDPMSGDATAKELRRDNIACAYDAASIFSSG